MPYLILGIILIIILLTLIMFVLLKNLVKSVNEKSKNYFIEKVQEYDNLKNEEVKKDEVKEENITYTIIDNNNQARDNTIVENIPDYQVNDFLSKYKEINSKFDFNYEKIINNFINNQKKVSTDYYKLLINLKKKINLDKIYELYTLSTNPIDALKQTFNVEELKIYENFIQCGSNDLEKFIIYLEEEIEKNDPHFYIEVGTNKENYNHLNPLIKTIVNDNIYRGIIIKYKNKMYDYSLN